MTNQSWNGHFILYIDMLQNLQLNKMFVCVCSNIPRPVNFSVITSNYIQEFDSDQ